MQLTAGNSNADRIATPATGFAGRQLQALLRDTGVELNGPNPWNPQIYHPKFYSRVLFGGLFGLGKSYMDEWWDCARLDEMMNRLLRAPFRSAVNTTTLATICLRRC